MNEMIEIHRQLLTEAAEVCRSLPAQIEKFAATVSSLPQAMVKLRLTFVQSVIIFGERYLRVEHSGKGFISVQAGHGMLSIHWSECDLLRGRKASAGSSGGVFLAAEVVVDKVKELLNQVEDGDLVAAVGWLSQYEGLSINGQNLLNWISSNGKKDFSNLEFLPGRNEIGNHLLGREPAAHVVSLIGQKPKTAGGIQRNYWMFKGFSRFLLVTGGNLHRKIMMLFSRVKSLFSPIAKLLKY